MAQQLPGREIPKEYREIVDHLSQGRRLHYDPSGKKRPVATHLTREDEPVDGYSVYVETRAPAGTGALPLPDDVWDRFIDEVEGLHGIVSNGEDWWSVQVTVDAASASEAINQAVSGVMSRAKDVRVPVWPVVKFEVTREDVLAEELDRPRMPEVVSGPEAADILGISTQRVHQLAAENSQFPAPVYDLRAGKIWLRAAVEVFASRERRPGRPRRIDVA